MAILAAYLDDSGTHQESKIAIVAGAIASKSQWLTLESNWDAFLNRHRIRAFHASDFSNSKGEFSTWDNAKKEAFIKKLGLMINKNIKLLLGQGVKVEDFDLVMKEYPQFKLSPVQYCTEKVLAGVTNWVNDHKRAEPIAVFFEAGQKIHSEEFKLYREAMNYGWLQKKYGLAGITIMQKNPPGGKPIRAFEVADYIAYETYKYHVNRFFDPTREVRKSMRALPTDRFQGYFDTPDSIRVWFEVLLKTRELSNYTS